MDFDKNDARSEKAASQIISMSSVADGDYSLHDALKAITSAANKLRNYKLPDLGINFDEVNPGAKFAAGDKATIYISPEEKPIFNDSAQFEIQRKRAALVHDLPPDQKDAYAREEKAYKTWALGTGMSDPPNMPVHEAIERKTNPGGRSDKELMPNWNTQGTIDLKTGLLM